MKKAISILLVLVMALSLCACGSTSNTESTPAAESTPIADSTAAETTAGSTPEGVDPEFKQTMDSYEAFFQDYCDFMKKYQANPTDLSLLADYSDFMAQYTDMITKMQELDAANMSLEDLEYYTEVTNRITKMLEEVTP